MVPLLLLENLHELGDVAVAGPPPNLLLLKLVHFLILEHDELVKLLQPSLALLTRRLSLRV